jgi:activating signal cointegrator complex subunit 1
LHATIVNMVYARGGHDRRNGAKGKKGGRATLDAQGILDRYEDWVWMDNVKVEKIAICKMGAQKTEVDGVVVDAAYEVEAEIDV